MTFDPSIRTDHNGNLLCPRCGFDHLRHRQVNIFDRREDAQDVVHTAVQEGTVSMRVVANNESVNPSDRRDGLIVRFSCEGCGETRPVFMAIAQVKGRTEIRWLGERGLTD